MKDHKLFWFNETEYVYHIQECFEGYYMPLQVLREFLGRPTMDEYSVITRKEWESIFPQIVLITLKSKRHG